MNKNRQKGFGTLAVLLILIILGLISFTGWYLWHARTQPKNTPNSSNNTAGICQVGAGGPCNQ